MEKTELENEVEQAHLQSGLSFVELLLEPHFDIEEIGRQLADFEVKTEVG